MKFSIIVPTYNRREKLLFVLERLVREEGIEDGEIVVVNDGSTDDTEAYLHDFERSHSVVRSFHIPNRGRSGARNFGLEKARGDLLLFSQDDMVVSEGWLKAHFSAHKRYPESIIVGYTTWYSGQGVTRYMRWLECGGHMLDFRGYENGDEMDYWHFYTGNLSLSRSVLGERRFDEHHREYGWEDILLGYFLALDGRPIRFSREAEAFHWDEYREEGLEEYMRKVGRSAAKIHARYPGAGIAPSFLKLSLLRSFVLAFRPFFRLFPLEFQWYWRMKASFLRGLLEQR